MTVDGRRIRCWRTIGHGSQDLAAGVRNSCNCVFMSLALSMGTDIGGSATPIGASANVVGTSVAAKNGHPVTWGKYCRYCAPATIMVMAVSMVCIVVRYM